MRRTLWMGMVVLSVLPLLTVQAQEVESKVIDGAYERQKTLNRRVIPYPYLREADVFWERRVWRDIHVKRNENLYADKMNLIFAYPRRPLSQILWEAVTSGEVTAYDILDDEFTTPLTPAEVIARYTRVDTQWTIDPLTGEEVQQIIETTFQPEYVSKYRLKEDWIFDKQRSMMYARIIGILPYYYEPDKQEAFAMFWLYYPDLRPILVNEEVFNIKNDSYRPSWDDIFQMRMFSSVIVKVSNVYDRMIQDYLTGLDALYEAEKIKNMIIDKEQFLWSY